MPRANRPLLPALRLSPGPVLLLQAIVFAIVPALFMLTKLVAAYRGDSLAFDFTHFELPAAREIYHGRSPYPTYGYPPLVAFALVPLVPVPGADIIVTVILVASIPAILWLLDVRDWRCYGLAFFSGPMFSAVQTANVTLPMMVALALAWRFRDATYRSGALVGIATATKILAWPAGLWLLATRRIRSWASACVVAFVLTFGLWSVIGFDGLGGYSGNLKTTGVIQANESYTLAVLASDIGVPPLLGRGIGVAVAVLLLGLCVWAAWRRLDRVSFAFAASACVYASPINWLHSFGFILLAVAVLTPRLSMPWFLMVPLVVCQGAGNGDTWQTALALGLGLVTVFAAVARWLIAAGDAGSSSPLLSGLAPRPPIGNM